MGGPAVVQEEKRKTSGLQKMTFTVLSPVSMKADGVKPILILSFFDFCLKLIKLPYTGQYLEHYDFTLMRPSQGCDKQSRSFLCS